MIKLPVNVGRVPSHVDIEKLLSWPGSTICARTKPLCPCHHIDDQAHPLRCDVVTPPRNPGGGSFLTPWRPLTSRTLVKTPLLTHPLAYGAPVRSAYGITRYSLDPTPFHKRTPLFLDVQALSRGGCYVACYFVCGKVHVMPLLFFQRDNYCCKTCASGRVS